MAVSVKDAIIRELERLDEAECDAIALEVSRADALANIVRASSMMQQVQNETARLADSMGYTYGAARMLGVSAKERSRDADR